LSYAMRRNRAGDRDPPTETETETETEQLDDKPRTGGKSPAPGRTPTAPGQKFPPQTDVRERTVWTLIMLAVFILVVAAGHLYLTGLVFFLSLGIFKEILQLKRRVEKEKDIPLFRLLNWYFFLVTCFFLYGRWLRSRLDVLALTFPIVEIFTEHMNFKAFCFYILGFVMFVLSLRKGFYRYQFGQFAWSHMTLLFVVAQSSVMIVNIFDGIFYFFLGAGLVIWNDIFAYIFGRWLGPKKWFGPFIALSPKKTWEGFIGALVTTVLFAAVFATILSMFPQIVCPQDTITLKPFSMPDCEPAWPFRYRTYSLPPMLKVFGDSVSLKPITLHSLPLGLFASIIAPFGGFFASGFKRAFKIKDFGDSIPGHGGITDRMDCQIMMSLFIYVYRISFLRTTGPTVTGVLSTIALMTAEQQLQLHQRLTEALTERQLL